MIMTKSVTESVFSKDSGRSYKHMKPLLKMVVTESVLESGFAKSSGLYEKFDWICEM